MDLPPFLPSPTSVLSSCLFISPLLLSLLWGELNRSVCHKGEKKRMLMKKKNKKISRWQIAPFYEVCVKTKEVLPSLFGEWKVLKAWVAFLVLLLAGGHRIYSRRKSSHKVCFSAFISVLFAEKEGNCAKK